MLFLPAVALYGLGTSLWGRRGSGWKPALLCNAGFGVFYWTFAVRYFFVCHLFPVIFMACGFTALVSAVLGRWQSGRWVAPGLAAGVCVLAGVTVSRMVALHPQCPPFQIPDAKRFAADVEERVPPGSLILAPRVMCEILSWFTHAESYPAIAAADREGTPDEEVLRARVQAELDRGQRVFLLQVRERPEHVPNFEDTPLGQFEVVYRPLEAGAAIGVSEPGDKCLLGTGWHAPGPVSKKQWGSWSSESADLEFYLKPIDADYVVRLHTLSGYRPAHAPPENLAVRVNGIPLPLQGETAPKGREQVQVAAVPRSSLHLGLNLVTFTADPWVPAQLTDSHDKRRLGVLLVRALLGPGAASP